MQLYYYHTDGNYDTVIGIGSFISRNSYRFRFCYPPCAAIYDVYQGYTEWDIYFFAHSGVTVPWIITVNKFQFFTNSENVEPANMYWKDLSTVILFIVFNKTSSKNG